MDTMATADLTELMQLDRSALQQRWASAFGCPAPIKSGQEFLRGALGWHAQMQALRGSTPKREVNRLVGGLTQKARASSYTLSPGTQLLREWQGRTHRVMVLDDGFEHEGKVYRSLTAISRLITGTAWSGPLFFGLRT